jgi:hypothetical protein
MKMPLSWVKGCRRSQRGTVPEGECELGGSCQAFVDQVLDYDPDHHLFLVRDNFLVALGNKKQPRKARSHALKDNPFVVNDAEGVPERAEMSMRNLKRLLRKKEDNIFLSAPAGFGKSYLVKEVITAEVEKKYGKKGVWVGAATGLAGLHIGGSTIHSLAGIGRAQGTVEELVERMSPANKKRWKDVKAIIVDEISMISGKGLELLDGIAKRLKRRTLAPFGGVRLILVGDFCQLPPVSELCANNEQNAAQTGVKWIRKTASYCFESRAWVAGQFKCIRPVHCYRYDLNSRLGNFLTALRVAEKLDPYLYSEMKALLDTGTVTLCY